MLTAQQRAIVKSTVPLLDSGGEALTTHFYRILLDEHPEVRPFFNQANQASGDQPRALANGVLMYARHIDELEALGGLVSKIVNKHVSLQIQPEHYPVVGACLLRAIREVLGAQVATDAVLQAWGAAYGQLAEILSSAEEGLYARTASAPGGWRGTREFVVARKEPESTEVTSFYLHPKDGQAVVDFIPGQYIGIRLRPDGEDIRRNYSLSAAPNGQSYRISVKREPGGIASGHLHDDVHVGDVVALFPPAGDFVLTNSSRPLVLISGGVGITPTLPMLEVALAAGRPVHFVHFSRHRGVHAFRDFLRQQQAAHQHLNYFYVYDEFEATSDASDGPHAVGRLDNAQLARFMPESRDVDVYFLGPKMFMRTIKRQLAELGVPSAQAQHEFFGPASTLD